MSHQDVDCRTCGDAEEHQGGDDELRGGECLFHVYIHLLFSCVPVPVSSTGRGRLWLHGIFLTLWCLIKKSRNMSKFIKVELADAKDPNGMVHINAEQISRVSKLGGKAKLRLSSGDILELKSPGYAELAALLGLPSDSKEG